MIFKSSAALSTFSVCSTLKNHQIQPKFDKTKAEKIHVQLASNPFLHGRGTGTTVPVPKTQVLGACSTTNQSCCCQGFFFFFSLYFIDSSSSGWWLLCRCGCCWLTTFLDFEHDSPQTIENEMPIYLSMLVHANRGIIIFYPNYVYYNFVQNMKSLS